MTAAEVKALVREGWSEKTFQKELLALADRLGWLTAHFRPAMLRDGAWVTAVQGDGKGFPDTVLVRPQGLRIQAARLIFAELKVKKRKPTVDQTIWLHALIAAGQEVYLWYPKNWPEIERVLA